MLGTNSHQPLARIPQCFTFGVTRDFFKPDSTFGFGDIGLELLERAPNVSYEFLREDLRS